MDPVINIIRKELIDNSDPAPKVNFQRYFKEQVQFYGVKQGLVTKIANKHWTDIKVRSKEEIFELCEELFRTNYFEEEYIVTTWVPKLKNRFEPDDFAVFQRWIEFYVTNWASCDSFCNHSVCDFVEKFTEYLDKLKTWASSSDRWMKRASAVSLIIPARHDKHLNLVFEITDLFLMDKDDMVQKGYGWLLKEASHLHQTEVFDYVMKNKKVMPRTALRYAIERMPKEMKIEAMKKDW